MRVLTLLLGCWENKRQLPGLERQHALPSGGKGGVYLFSICFQRPKPPSEAEEKAEDPGDPVTHTSPVAKPYPTLPWEAGAGSSVGGAWLSGD